MNLNQFVDEYEFAPFKTKRAVFDKLISVHFTELTINHLKKFQADYFNQEGEGITDIASLERYSKKLYQELLLCLKLELSPKGAELRKELGLSPLPSEINIE